MRAIYAVCLNRMEKVREVKNDDLRLVGARSSFDRYSLAATGALSIAFLVVVLVAVGYL